jgi:hypothetical protein
MASFSDSHVITSPGLLFSPDCNESRFYTKKYPKIWNTNQMEAKEYR